MTFRGRQIHYDETKLAPARARLEQVKDTRAASFGGSLGKDQPRDSGRTRRASEARRDAALGCRYFDSCTEVPVVFEVICTAGRLGSSN